MILADEFEETIRAAESMAATGANATHVIELFRALAELEPKDLEAQHEATGQRAVAEECARLCQREAMKAWKKYKRGDGPERANPHTEGFTDGAEACASIIDLYAATLPQ